MNKIKLGAASMCAFFLLAGCGQTGNNETPGSTAETTETSKMETSDTSKETASSNSAESSSGADSETNSSEDLSKGIQSHEFGISLNAAMKMFTDEFGDVSLDSVEFKEQNGQYRYEVEGFDDTKEYELDIDAESGEVLNKKQENDSGSHEELNTDGMITPKEAMDIALKEADEGAFVTSWELQIENGRTAYEVELDYANQEDEDITIDAHTGDILER